MVVYIKGTEKLRFLTGEKSYILEEPQSLDPTLNGLIKDILHLKMLTKLSLLVALLEELLLIYGQTMQEL